jgi:hypothetical protein
MRVGRLVVQRDVSIDVVRAGIDPDHVRSRGDHDDTNVIDVDRTDSHRARGCWHHGHRG